MTYEQLRSIAEQLAAGASVIQLPKGVSTEDYVNMTKWDYDELIRQEPQVPFHPKKFAVKTEDGYAVAERLSPEDKAQLFHTVIDI